MLILAKIKMMEVISKIYHRRYRASFKHNEQKVFETYTYYSRFRRKV